MRIRPVSIPIDKVHTDTMVLSFFQDERPLKGSTGLADWRTCGMLSDFILNNNIDGRFKEKLLLPVKEDIRRRINCQRLLMVGLGPKKDYDFDKCSQVMEVMLSSLMKLSVTQFALTLPGVGQAGLDYGLASTRFCETLAFTYRRKPELMALVDAVIVAQGARLKEISNVASKHEARINQELGL